MTKADDSVELWDAVKIHLESISRESGLSVTQIINILVINHYQLLGYVPD